VNFDKRDNGIEIHHKYYIRHRLPWQYPDNCFMILCNSCHNAYHKLRKIPVYDDIDSKHCRRYDFDDLLFGRDYYTGDFGLQFLKKMKRVAFVPAGDEPSIWISQAAKTIGQLIYGSNLPSIYFPLMAGKIYKKKFSKDHIEYYIEGWSTGAFLSAQQMVGNRFPNIESSDLNRINFSEFVRYEFIWSGVTAPVVQDPMTDMVGLLGSKEITDQLMKSKSIDNLLNPVVGDSYFIPIKKGHPYNKASYEIFAYQAKKENFGHNLGDKMLIAE
jgi:hypothetical protein